MKSIRNIRDLEYEKLKLRVRQLELERQMEGSWKKITEKLSHESTPQRSAEPQNNVHFKTGNKLLNVALNYGSDFLTHRLGMLAGKKIETMANNVLEKLSGRINTTASKRGKRI